MTSAPRKRSEATSLASCRWYSVSLFAPRQSVAAPAVPSVQPAKVLKKLSRLALAILMPPVPTAGGAVGRGFTGSDVAEPPRAPTGRSRYALPLAELPAQV